MRICRIQRPESTLHLSAGKIPAEVPPISLQLHYRQRLSGLACWLVCDEGDYVNPNPGPKIF